ncbi:hypothetical protein ACIQUQ_05985 [Streptomyces sp. NPDC101118]|uniref:hypothetical protein n=1 Tax=Streptomyces sp. NPDC101118 TaxID=3366109 RepID=UPI0037FD5270
MSVLTFDAALAGALRAAGTDATVAPSRAALLHRAYEETRPRVLHLTGTTAAASPDARDTAGLALRLAGERSALVCLEVDHRAATAAGTKAGTPAGTATGAAARTLRAWAPRADALIATEDGLALCLPDHAAGDTAARAGELLALGVGEVLVRHEDGAVTAYTDDGSAHRTGPPAETAQETGGPMPAAGTRAPGTGHPATPATTATPATGTAAYLAALLGGAPAHVRVARAAAGGWSGPPAARSLCACLVTNSAAAPVGTPLR